ncbi:pyrroloquinoline quinone biosynthesis peptide chaperone PqqD [Sedimentitalea sp. JM2-8]|uniref:Pyrroloquinoline quinone biosynthesis peptide chaperone PqqD n=1 Tax=Sedimentitalea xiamensis TaxID=3050037 RepID=A0ABT7F9U7_9RHOB|nr:pyrroloquinoline quinone biosynthesis peptide chaperone PqqD [Sedimentitalea xiamensis]MDK3071890.1 pyrroloquinoline quinone biosynthesis peptide chaperone PqqD [Sedimentitalea xiamensis]
MILELAPTDRPFLPRGVRVQPDRVRGGMVLLAPEKAIRLDAIGEAILARVTGQASFDEIVDDLAQTYNAPRDQIGTDVQRFLVGLRARMYLGVNP